MNCKVCGNTSAKNSSISFFRFPKENFKCRDWADRCDLLDLFEKHGSSRFYKSFRICSEHFELKDVVFDGRKKRLLQSATPQRLLTNKYPPIQEELKNLQPLQNLCRLCAEENENLTDIFGRRGKLLDLEKKLKHLPQAINENDVLPVKICHNCVLKLDEFYDFITKCIKADTKLRTMLAVDQKDCTGSRGLIKSDACDSKLDWIPLMETNLNETPKIQDFADSFRENLSENYYDQTLEKTLFTEDDTDYLSRVTDTDFAKTDQLYSHENLIKEIDFNPCAGVDHDYFKMTSPDELQSETKIQMTQEQLFIEETEFRCDNRLESIHEYDTLSNHFLTPDTNRESLSEIYDKGFLDRFHKNQNIQSEDSRQGEKNHSCRVCDKEFDEFAFIDSHKSENGCSDTKSSRFYEVRRESKTETRLKRILKCEETKSNHVHGSNLFSQSHLKLKRRNCRVWKKLSKNNTPINTGKIQTGKSFSKKKITVRASNEFPQKSVLVLGQSHRCVECGKFFRSKASLRQHRPVHSDKRSHNCQECGMSFKRKDTLSNHLRIHTGERPYICKVCGFAFKQRGDCMKHEKNHEKYTDIMDNTNAENQIFDPIVMDSNFKKNSREDSYSVSNGADYEYSSNRQSQ